jgi:lipoate-protein ligase A
MKLYNLGKVPWQETQLIYHALADLGRESLVLVSPASPYVCIGYHQNVTHEVDTDFCRENNIPIFRRKVGGGAVYLDGDQLFFHLILRRKNPAIPPSKNAFYQKFLQPIVNIHHRIGIPAEYKPVNDIIVNNRKISGTGVGEIGECIVFVGNLILDFNYEMMSRILKVPDEKFRDKVRKTIEDNLTTIQREQIDDQESGRWDELKLNALLADEFGKLLGLLDPCAKDDLLISKMAELGSQMNADAWLYRKGKPVSLRSVKIRSGVEVAHRMHKSPGGLIRTDFEVREGKLSSVSISGDFFCYPKDSITQLESMLEGTSTAEIQKVLKEFYSRQDIETPGVDLQDWMKVLST